MPARPKEPFKYILHYFNLRAPDVQAARRGQLHASKFVVSRLSTLNIPVAVTSTELDSTVTSLEDSASLIVASSLVWAEAVMDVVISSNTDGLDSVD